MTYQDLQKLQKESEGQVLPTQKKVLSAADKIRRKTSNLPDPTHPPMGWKDGKGYDHIFPWIHLPRLHPKNHGDTVIFNDPKAPANQLILGDNLEVLRTLPTESIDLIYIDPPFFSGRNYNVIWGDLAVQQYEDPFCIENAAYAVCASNSRGVQFRKQGWCLKKGGGPLNFGKMERRSKI